MATAACVCFHPAAASELAWPWPAIPGSPYQILLSFCSPLSGGPLFSSRLLLTGKVTLPSWIIAHTPYCSNTSSSHSQHLFYSEARAGALESKV